MSGHTCPSRPSEWIVVRRYSDRTVLKCPDCGMVMVVHDRREADDE